MTEDVIDVRLMPLASDGANFALPTEIKKTVAESCPWKHLPAYQLVCIAAPCKLFALLRLRVFAASSSNLTLFLQQAFDFAAVLC